MSGNETICNGDRGWEDANIGGGRTGESTRERLTRGDAAVIGHIGEVCLN